MPTIQKGNLYFFEDLGFVARVDQEGPPLDISIFEIVDRLDARDQEDVSFLVYHKAGSDSANCVTAHIEKASVFCLVTISEKGDLEIDEAPTAFPDRINLRNWFHLLNRLFSIATEKIEDIQYYVDGDYLESKPGPEYEIADDGTSLALGYERITLKTLRQDGTFK